MYGSDELSRQFGSLQYPLQLSFKLISLVNQVFVVDAAGNPVLYTRQKMFKLREHVEIFTDRTRETRLADIRADKVLDWSARYFATEASGGAIGSVGRRGWRSIWRAHYEVFNPADESPGFSIREESPMIKVADSVIGGIPILGFFSGYFLHPSFLASRADGSPAMRVTKQPAFFEGKFEIEKLADLSPREELNLVLSFMMLVLLERERG